MSVQLESVDGEYADNVCNGTWLVATRVGHGYEGDKVHLWNGYHDTDTWTPTELKLMADRIEQLAKLVPTLRELAEHGGVKIS